MANLNETDEWPSGVYQWEEDDPVIGGPAGIDNVPTRQLASRGRFQRLRNITPWDAELQYPANVAYVSFGGSTWRSVEASTNVQPGTDATKWTRWAHTEDELTGALGDVVNAHEEKADPHPVYWNDVRGDAKIAAAVAPLAPLESPALTGNPTAPTPAQFDNDTSLATTAHVQRALGSYSNAKNIGITGANALQVTDAGQFITVSVSGVTLTLPTLAQVPPGASFVLEPLQRCVLQRSAADSIVNASGATVTSMALYSPCIVISRGDFWYVMELTNGGDADAGTVFFTARSTPPPGSIKANSAAVSRTVYSRLFDAIGTTFGAGDGVNTFNVPEGRAEFIRGLDDGRGLDVGRVLGSFQDGTWLRTLIQEWSGADSTTSGTYTVGIPHAGPDGVITGTGVGSSVPTGALASSGSAWQAGASDNFAQGSITVDAGVTNRWIRMRPRNLALLACIKF